MKKFLCEARANVKYKLHTLLGKINYQLRKKYTMLEFSMFMLDNVHRILSPTKHILIADRSSVPSISFMRAKNTEWEIIACRNSYNNEQVVTIYLPNLALKFISACKRSFT